MQRQLFIGLMSGTSVDGIDAALVDFGGTTATLVHAIGLPFADELQKSIQHIILHPNHISLDSLGALDVALGHAYADAVLKLLAVTQLEAKNIIAIGNHGQTIRHQPDSELPFSLQIGDNNIVAERTGITSIGDFRRRDIAAGGQGAPLVPAFHQALFNQTGECRVILNIGGIANITVLDGDHILGFDTGPGNTLMDAACSHYADIPYDANGELAAQGLVNETLLQELLAHPYFQQAPPKSTGRELFNLEWLQQHLRETDEISEADLLATLSSLSAFSITQAIQQHTPSCERVLVCGGGVHNQHLMDLLAQQLNCPVQKTNDYGIDADWVEAAAFAWLAQQTHKGLAGNLPSATGALGFRVLGSVYPA